MHEQKRADDLPFGFEVRLGVVYGKQGSFGIFASCHSQRAYCVAAHLWVCLGFCYFRERLRITRYPHGLEKCLFGSRIGSCLVELLNLSMRSHHSKLTDSSFLE